MCSTATRRGSMASRVSRSATVSGSSSSKGSPLSVMNTARWLSVPAANYGKSRQALDAPAALVCSVRASRPDGRPRPLPPQPRPHARAVRPARRVRVLRAADRAAEPGRVLRRPPAGVRRQHADQERARAAGHRRRTSRRSSRAASTPRPKRRPSRAATRRGRRATRCASTPARPTRWIADAIAGADLERRRIIRCCTTRRRSGRSSSTRRCTRKRSPTCGTSFRMRCKRKPEHYVTAPPRLALRAPRPTRRAVAIPAGHGDARDRPATSAFAWDNERPAHAVAVTPFDIDAHNVTNARVHGVRGRRRLPRSAVVARRGLGLGARGDVSPSAVLGARGRRRWYWRGMFERVPLPRGLAGVRDMGRGERVRALARARLPTEAEFHRAAFGTPEGDERRYPWGDGIAGPAARAISTSCAGIPSRWAPIRTAPAPSASTISSATGGSGRHVFAPFDGFAPIAVVPGVLGRLLRRRPLRDEGRVAGDRARPRASRVPQLVPAAVSVRLRHIPHAWVRRDGPYAAPRQPPRHATRSPPRCANTCSARRASCRPSTSTTSSARRSSRRSAGCRGTASRAPSRRCSPRTRREILAAAARGRSASPSSAAAAARSWRSCGERRRADRR